MPAWRGKLSKEQIWALIYFVEYQSGGIEGRFPPSLYPRETRPRRTVAPAHTVVADNARSELDVAAARFLLCARSREFVGNKRKQPVVR